MIHFIIIISICCKYLLRYIFFIKKQFAIGTYVLPLVPTFNTTYSSLISRIFSTELLLFFSGVYIQHTYTPPPPPLLDLASHPQKNEDANSIIIIKEKKQASFFSTTTELEDHDFDVVDGLFIRHRAVPRHSK